VIVAIAVVLIGTLPTLWSLQRLHQRWRFWRGEQLEQRRLQLRIVRLTRQQGHLLLTLSAADGSELPPVRPGQHLQLFYQDADGRPVSRAYSLAQDCQQSRYYRLAIKAEQNGRLSRQIFQQAQRGDILTTSLPTGHFQLQRSTAPLVLIAAGVGITPMLAMLYQALRLRRPVTLIYQARTSSSLLYHRLLSRLPGLRYIPLLSQPDPHWCGESGRLSAERLMRWCDASADYYCCANATMTAKLQQDLLPFGVHLRYELFSAAASNQNVVVEYGDISANCAGFSSVLDALNHAGACIPSDCRGGSCGLCKKRLVRGEVIQMLDPAAAIAPDEILTCCVQAKTTLLLAD